MSDELSSSPFPRKPGPRDKCSLPRRLRVDGGVGMLLCDAGGMRAPSTKLGDSPFAWFRAVGITGLRVGEEGRKQAMGGWGLLQHHDACRGGSWPLGAACRANHAERRFSTLGYRLRFLGMGCWFISAFQDMQLCSVPRSGPETGDGGMGHRWDEGILRAISGLLGSQWRKIASCFSLMCWRAVSSMPGSEQNSPIGSLRPQVPFSTAGRPTMGQEHPVACRDGLGRARMDC